MAPGSALAIPSGNDTHEYSFFLQLLFSIIVLEYNAASKVYLTPWLFGVTAYVLIEVTAKVFVPVIFEGHYCTERHVSLFSPQSLASFYLFQSYLVFFGLRSACSFFFIFHFSWVYSKYIWYLERDIPGVFVFRYWYTPKSPNVYILQQ